MSDQQAIAGQASPDPAPPLIGPPPIGLWALFLKFLGFGLLAFGGPAAQIAMLKRELIEREGWMSPSRFNRLLAVMQVLPGPEAHELCVHLGMRARGRVGGLLAGLGFMAPGFALMMILSALYLRLDLNQPWIAGALLGVQAAVIALIVRAVRNIGHHALSDRLLGIAAAAAALATLAGAAFWIVLPACGLAYAAAKTGRGRWAWIVTLVGAALAVASTPAVLGALMAPSPALSAAAPSVATASGSASLVLLFAAGLKAGLLTFGGAYTAIPFVRADAVPRGWVQDSQFLDGLALSGVLPAPLIIFVTFVGYLAGGPLGAVAMTAGVFLPAFAFSLIFYDRLEAVVENPRLHALLEGVAAAVVGLIAVTAVQLGWGLLHPRLDQPFVLATLVGIALLAFLILRLWSRPTATPVILAAAAVAGGLLLAGG